MNDQNIEDCHQGDADVTQIPDEVVSGDAADEEHNEREDLVDRLARPVASEQISDVRACVVEHAEEGRKAEQKERDEDEDLTCRSEVIGHRGQQKIGSVFDTARDRLGDQKEDECRAGADDDRVDEDAECLKQADLCGVVAFCRRGGAGG